MSGFFRAVQRRAPRAHPDNCHRAAVAIAVLLTANLLPPGGLARAAGNGNSSAHLLIREHRFEPSEIHLSAGTALQIAVENRDASVEEFESYDLDREQRVQPGEVLQVHVGPLKPGRYEFFGDFHRATAQGVLIID